LDGVRLKVLFVNISYKKAEKNKEKKRKLTAVKKQGKYKKLSDDFIRCRMRQSDLSAEFVDNTHYSANIFLQAVLQL